MAGPAPLDHRVRRDKIDSFGKVTLRYLSRLRHIAADVPHKNRKVRLLMAGPDVRNITDGELIRALTLDPTRSYQPIGGRWSVHNVLQQVSSMSQDGTERRERDSNPRRLITSAVFKTAAINRTRPSLRGGAE